MARKFKWFEKTAVWLLAIGGLNWGLVGAFDFNLVSTLLGGITTWLVDFAYILVGISGLTSLYTLFTK